MLARSKSNYSVIRVWCVLLLLHLEISHRRKGETGGTPIYNLQMPRIISLILKIGSTEKKCQQPQATSNKPEHRSSFAEGVLVRFVPQASSHTSRILQ